MEREQTRKESRGMVRKKEQRRQGTSVQKESYAAKCVVGHYLHNNVNTIYVPILGVGGWHMKCS